MEHEVGVPRAGKLLYQGCETSLDIQHLEKGTFCLLFVVFCCSQPSARCSGRINREAQGGILALVWHLEDV